MWTRPQPDAAWWTGAVFEGQPVGNALRARDVAVVFRFLRTKGWSRSAIAAATGLSETRVRQVARGRQKITSYEVLERVAAGLGIERGLMGLAYTQPHHVPQPASRIRAGS